MCWPVAVWRPGFKGGKGMRARRSLLSLLGVLALVGGLFAPAASGAPPASKPVNWAPCYSWLTRQIQQTEGREVKFECGQVAVPLDHDQPRGASVLVAVLRIPATDPANRIGSLFLNPGGPGGSGVEFAAAAGPYLYSEEVRASFDMVGFDPRGIGRSTQLRCLGSVRQIGPWFTDVPWPETPDEIQRWGTADAQLQADCDQRGGRILDHMSTADVARDLDILRAAVGDDALTYAGYSYGSYLGATYANLFPDKVRALVVDGVLDPVAWSTGDPGQENLPFTTRLRSDVGAQDTLNEFFRLCDEAGEGCAFSDPAGSAARYDALHDLLSTSPITFDDFVYDERMLVGDTLGPLYNSAVWPDFAAYLAAVESIAETPDLLDVAAFQSQRRSVGAGRGGFPNYPGYEGFQGVGCADSTNPDTLAAWTAAAAEPQDSYFGPLWTWASSSCSAWPGDQTDRYTGPWNAKTANPVLVVNTTFDPATPLHGADRLASLLPNSRQLTVKGWGHTTLFLSADADQAVSDYLVNGNVPAPGTVFTQDVAPFASLDSEGEGESLRAKYARIAFDHTR